MNDDEKVCPRCAETIKRAAIVCRYCGHEFTPTAGTTATPPSGGSPPTSDAPADPSAKKREPNNAFGKVVGFGCLGLLALFMLAAIIGGGGQTANNSASDVAVDMNATTDLNTATDEVTNAADVALNADEATSSAGWSYRTSRDELRGKTISYASADSENSANFDFPYAGGSTLTMTVRRHPKYGDDVYFRISTGQFVCGIEDCQGTINYGDGPHTITLVEPDDNSSDMLFASNGSAVIGNLKNAKRVIVELPFYQEGNRQFTFETKGLNWPPK